MLFFFLRLFCLCFELGGRELCIRFKHVNIKITIKKMFVKSENSNGIALVCLSFVLYFVVDGSDDDDDKTRNNSAAAKRGLSKP